MRVARTYEFVHPVQGVCSIATGKLLRNLAALCFLSKKTCNSHTIWSLNLCHWLLMFVIKNNLRQLEYRKKWILALQIYGGASVVKKLNVPVYLNVMQICQEIVFFV
jgi:hypothetical protein